MKKPFVCLMNDSFPPLIDGVATTVTQYAKYMTENYGSAVVATPQYPDVTDNYIYPVVRYPSINTTKLLGYRAGLPFHAPSLRELEQYPIDIIHSHCPFVSTYLARTLRNTMDAPIVFTYHTKFDIDIAKAVHSGLLQETAIRLLVDNVSACDEVWVVSRGAGENLRKLGYEGDVYLMENGVDFPRGTATEEQIRTLRAELQKDYGLDTTDGKPLFLFVGRMMWYKGHRIMLDALKALAAAGKDFHMLFIGDGTDMADIQKYTKELSLDNRCIFTGAVRDREKLRAFYSIATLFLFPSSYDTNGIVVREAAACGLASMLISGSCAAEGVADGETGFLIEENAEAAAALLSRICEKPSLAYTVGRNAMQTLYLSWEDAVGRASSRYETIIERYKSGTKRIAEPLSDDLLLAASDMLETMNKFHSARTAWYAMATDSARRGIAEAEKLREDVVDKIRQGGVGVREYGKELKEQISEHMEDLWDWFDRYL